MLVFVDNGMCVGQTYTHKLVCCNWHGEGPREVGYVTWWEAGGEDETLFRLKLEMSILLVSPLSSSTYSSLLGATVPLGEKETDIYLRSHLSIMSPHVGLPVLLIIYLAWTPNLFPGHTRVFISFLLMTLCVFPEHLTNGL